MREAEHDQRVPRDLHEHGPEQHDAPDGRLRRTEEHVAAEAEGEGVKEADHDQHLAVPRDLDDQVPDQHDEPNGRLRRAEAPAAAEENAKGEAPQEADHVAASAQSLDAIDRQAPPGSASW